MVLTVFSQGNKKDYYVEKNTRLFDALQKNGFVFSAPCGGKSICGGCAVKASGELSAPTDEERDFLAKRLELGYRLACFAYIKGDVTVFEWDSNPQVVPFSVGYKPAVSSSEKSEDENECFACAVDIGTTTILAATVCLPSGKIFETKSFLNPLVVFGEDVMTRITNAKNDGYLHMHRLITDLLEEYFLSLPSYPKFCVFAGNTTMLHIVSELDPSQMGVFPFVPKSLFGTYIGNDFYFPCAAAFSGGDLFSSVIASGMTTIKNTLLMDIGTNCELALWNGEKLFCTSAPAGPAFEGRGIKSGMIATNGAICSIVDNDGTAEVRTVGNYAAVGFCGSGLIDAIAFLLNNEILSYDGILKFEKYDFSGVLLDSEDISKIQLAKSAVFSAAECLASKAGVTFDELDRVFLCGNFGSFINPKNAARIGLIPQAVVQKTSCIGNSALAGAVMAVIDSEYRKKACELAQNCVLVELGGNSDFEQKFIKNMYFDSNGTL